MAAPALWLIFSVKIGPPKKLSAPASTPAPHTMSDVAVEPAAAAPSAGADAPAPARRLVFRLDDGTVIRAGAGAEPVEVLRPKEAWHAGLLRETHLIALEAKLCEVHAKLPDEGDLKSISTASKRSMDSVLEVRAPALRARAPRRRLSLSLSLSRSP